MTIRSEDRCLAGSKWLAGLAAGILGVVAASAVVAQQLGPQEFRDPKTGQIWTPENVGGRSGPNTPQDRAFNPQGQVVTSPGNVVQTPAVTAIGSVPITAGPAVPIAVIDNATLSVIPGQRWQVVLYLDNNSGTPINPVIECRFTNAGNAVQTTTANLPTVSGGQRVGLTIYGPETTLFVDRADCRLRSPA